MFYAQSTGGFYDNAIHGNAIPADAVPVTDQQHQMLLEGQSAGQRIVADAEGRPVLQAAPPPTQAQVIAQYEAALDAHLDSVAKQHRYNDRFTFALRAGYHGPYHDEGVAFAQWMDNCNAQAYATLQAVLAGQAAMPSVEDFIGGLPALELT